MSPDTQETRLRNVEQAVAALQTQHQDHERDIRQYAPSLIELARLQEKLSSVSAELRVVGASVTDLRMEWRRDVEHFNHEVEAVRSQQAADKLDIEKHRSAREEKEREREKVDRRWRITTVLTLCALTLTTIGLGFTLVTLLTQAPK